MHVYIYIYTEFAGLGKKRRNKKNDEQIWLKTPMTRLAGTKVSPRCFSSQLAKRVLFGTGKTPEDAQEQGSLKGYIYKPPASLGFGSSNRRANVYNCGWTTSCTTSKPWLKPCIVVIYREIESFHGFLGGAKWMSQPSALGGFLLPC